MAQDNDLKPRDCRQLLQEIVKPIFEKTVAKLGQDEVLKEANWGAEREGEIHLSVLHKRTGRTYMLQYHCHEHRVHRRTTVKPPPGDTFGSKRSTGFQLWEFSEKTAQDHVNEFRELALAGRLV